MKLITDIKQYTITDEKDNSFTIEVEEYIEFPETLTDEQQDFVDSLEFYV